TLIYLFITKGQIPAYLGSSFAFISLVFVVLRKYNVIEGYQYVLGGFLCVGIVLCLVAWIVKIAGTAWIDVLFPPAAMGAIVAVIGLELVPVAAEMTGWIQPEDEATWAMDPKEALVALLTLIITLVCWITLRGFFKIIPILIGIVAGYLIYLSIGIVDLSVVNVSSWFSLRQYYQIKFDWSAIIVILPAALVLLPEHIGHLFVTGNIVGKD